MKRLGILLLIVMFMLILPGFAFAEGLTVKKMVLARFAVKNGNIELSKGEPYWSKIDRHTLAIDDRGRMYVLNLWNNEIMVFDNEGKLQKQIRLGVEVTKYEYSSGKIMVSGDGKQFLIEGYNSGRLAQYEFNQRGSVVRRFSENVFVWNFPDIRLCNKPNYIFKKGGLLYDVNFRPLKDKFSGYADSEGKYNIYLSKKTLYKTSKNGKRLWEKQFDGYFGVIGLDDNNYVYIEGRLRKGDPDSVYKLNPKGEIIAQASIPDPFPFLTQEEKDEWDAHSSEESLSFFKLACNGDLYLIYQLGDLPSITFDRWLQGGDYFIYKFEKADKDI